MSNFINSNVIAYNSPLSHWNGTLKDGRYVIKRGGIDFEFLIQNTLLHSNKKIFVLLSGARDPKSHPIPKFDRWKWVDKFPGIMINVSDPAFYKKENSIRIGWYTGSRECNYIKNISYIISELAAGFQISSKDIIFYGSSAGGFASLALASHVQGATAVAINPQINVLKYNLKHVVNNFLSYVYQVKITELTDQDMIRLDASRMFSLAKSAKCLYVQNVLDFHHYEDHYEYFINSLSKESSVKHCSRLETLLFSSKAGHGPEPGSLVGEIIEKALSLSNK
ncbi:hypothetical protein [Halomonas sp. A29]|uniref:hypothetical protein n=1 Tax=Halomonas sp. A29 TaxID=3102786 RepID=UPI00398B932D